MDFTTYLNAHYAPSTIKRYKREIALYMDWLQSKNKTAQAAKYNDILSYIGTQRKQNKKVRCSLHGIKVYYNYLVSSEKREDNPAKAIHLKDSKNRDVQIQDLFKTEELEQLLNRKERYSILKNRNRIIISLLIYQGLTSSEIQNLELEDIDLETGTVSIKAGRRSNSRRLKLESKQVFWMFAYLSKDREILLKTESNKLIISKQANKEVADGIGHLLKSYRYLFPGRNLNAKTIRQSVICNLLQSKKDLRLVQVFAGHRYPSSTEKYRQSEVEALKSQILKYHPLQ